VIHEHDALALASAAIDFDLSQAEARELSAAVGDCPICAERAGVYRRHMRLLAEMPVLEAPDATRRRVMQAAMTGHVVDTRTPMLLFAAALLLGALLAVVAAIGGAFTDRRLSELPPLESPRASVAPAVANASTSPFPEASLPVGPPGGGPEAVLTPGLIADVVSDNVRIRSKPGVTNGSVKFEPVLKIGDRLLVIAGPVAADDYDWYQVAAWRPSRPSMTWPIGWAVRADHDGTPWLETTSQPCQSSPDFGQVAALNPYEALGCFGHQQLTLRAFIGGGEPVDGCNTEGQVGRCITGPTWLAGVGGRTAFVDGVAAADTSGATTLQLAIDPNGSVNLSDLPAGRMSVIEGSFDHPDAARCGVAGDPSALPALTLEDAILRCRTRFVVSRSTTEPNYLVPDTAAITTTDGLRVRSLPTVDEPSQRFEPLLNNGTRLFVLNGPALGSGYDWYRVIAPAIARADGGPMVGWIAVASRTGETWAAEQGLNCPPADGPVALSELSRLASGAVADGGLSCFGRSTITTSAIVQVVCSGPSPRATALENWLASPSGMTIQMQDAGATITARAHPDLAGRTPCERTSDQRWLVEGHFDDVDSASCATGSATEATGAVAEYRCRTAFVVTRLTPLGA
jgi:hypothetical protein